MVDASAIRPHMPVKGSDGQHVGTVDHLDGDLIKLTKNDSPDGQHHYVPLSSVTRVDEHVHLSTTKPAALAGVTATTDGTAAVGSPLPPVKNRAVEGAAPRKNFYLRWVVGAVGLLLLLLLFKSCVDNKQDAAMAPVETTSTTATITAALPLQAVTLPNGQKVDVEPNTLNFQLQEFLASNVAAPRTFTFDRLNFATSSAVVRAEDQPTIDTLALILNAYPEARVRLDGYADGRGSEPVNAQLGRQRAAAVADALVAKGVKRSSISAASGGEGNPQVANATASGQAENRRTELTVLAR